LELEAGFLKSQSFLLIRDCSGAGAEHINPGRGNCRGSTPVWM